MIPAEQNQRLTLTGPGTPMGALFRSYWLPVLLSRELAPGGAPQALTILSEHLVAWRARDGAIGLVSAACPHRGTHLAYARNEGGALVCIAHGWQIARTGKAASPGSTSVCLHPAYPAVDAGGLLWAYLSSESPPPFPAWPWSALPADHLVPVKVRVDCNWLQHLEGGVDTSHINFLHRDDIPLVSVDPDPLLRILDTPYGFRYAGLREGPDPLHRWVRVTHFAWPMHVVIPPPRGRDAGIQMQQMVVPIDDRSHWFFGIRFRLGEALNDNYTAQFDLDEAFRPRRRRENGHLQDRERMARGHWSGINGVRSQDLAVVESAPAIVDRSREHLVSADLAVIHLRQRLLAAADEVQAGHPAPGRTPPELFRQLWGVEALEARPLDDPTLPQPLLEVEEFASDSR